MPPQVSKRTLQPFLMAIGIWALVRSHLCASLLSMDSNGSIARDRLSWEWWLWSVVGTVCLTIAIIRGRDNRGS
jgi:hypothetical protein